MSEPLLHVEHLSIAFPDKEHWETVVNDISFTIDAGETLALIGESGSGKSMTSLAIMQLLPHIAAVTNASHIWYHKHDLLELPEQQMRDIRGHKIGMIFQEPMTSLNPVMTVEQQLGEVINRHTTYRGATATKRKMELLDHVGIPAAKQRLKEYPHQLSGGMKQRIMIAMALAGEPDLLIADEPTTALDVTIQAQVLSILQSLQRETNMALLLITHDFGVVRTMADRLAVMKNGVIVEQAEAETFFQNPQNEYSQKLLDSLPGQGTDKIATAASPPRNDGIVLSARDIKIEFPIKKGLFKRTVGSVKAVDGVSLALEAGKTLAIVGESGCGKTTLGKGILQLLQINQGEVCIRGEDIQSISTNTLRRDIQVIMQDPYSSMNPKMFVGDIIAEGIDALGLAANKSERAAKIDELIQMVGLPKDSAERYPHEFSGGQRQRISIARALAVEPNIIICDEPTSALDVSIQAQILTLLKDIQEKKQLAYLFISHDLAVVEEVADEIAVMYLGRIVEQAPTYVMLNQAKHPYTRALLASIPNIQGEKTKLSVVQGELPSPIDPPTGCHFHPRCTDCISACQSEYPPTITTSKAHEVACWLYSVSKARDFP